MEVLLSERSSISSLGRTIVSVAVRMVTDLSSSLLTIPVMTRASTVTKTVGWYSFAISALRVDDIGQQVLHVGPVRAGKIRPDVRPNAIQCMTLLTRLGEHGTTELRVGHGSSFLVRSLR